MRKKINQTSRRAAVRRYVVKSTGPRGHDKRVTLRNEKGEGEHEIILQRFAMVGRGDVLRVTPGIERRVSIVAEDGAEEVPVWPPYETHQRVQFAGEKTEARVAEIVTKAELDEVIYLEKFHYRGLDLSEGPTAGPTKGKGGRRAILILQLKLGRQWKTVGYIEMQMPLMMAKPRHDAFDRPYKHPARKVAWMSWRKGGESLVNRICRIARVVVHPDLRGAGLSSPLVIASIEFARTRWHIRGQRALFLEISAEMLKHVDFVSQAGFHYLGNTEGNRERIAKDLVSINNGAGGASGIMSLQRKYFASFAAYREKSGDSFASLLARLDEVLTSKTMWETISPDEWLALRPLVRNPIPYYMIGLDSYSERYVRKAAKSPNRGRGRFPKQKSKNDLVLRDVSIWSKYEIQLSAHTRLVMDGFGIAARALNIRLAGPVNHRAAPGTVTLIAGSSGCGKSILLSQLDPCWTASTIERTGEIIPRNYTAGWLRPLPNDLALFEALASTHGAERTFHALSRVGLSEALLFLKPFWMLSRGQRYRAMLADLMLRDDEVWLVDEFCSDLDPLTARLVAHRFRETVRQQGRVAVVAAANHRHFLHSLRPAAVLTLNTSGASIATTWREQTDAIHC